MSDNKQQTANNVFSNLYSELSDESRRMIYEAELVKQMLLYCSAQPDAKITITVEHDNGSKAIAELYDLAAFVTSLYDALEYFQNELS